MNLDSPEGFPFVDDEDGYVAFRVIAEIMPLPSDKDLIVPLMRDLLECNSLILGGSRFRIALGSVYATAGQLVESMEDEDYADHIHGVLTMAQVSSGEVMKKHGGTRRKRAERAAST